MIRRKWAAFAYDELGSLGVTMNCWTKSGAKRQAHLNNDLCVLAGFKHRWSYGRRKK